MDNEEIDVNTWINNCKRFIALHLCSRLTYEKMQSHSGKAHKLSFGVGTS
jgi:hypothetical protein